MSGLKQKVLARVRGSVALTSAAFAADNFLATLGVAGADPAPDEHLSGADIEGDIAYAKSVADHYRRFGDVKGRVAEIGPGGSAAVGLFLLAGGAKSVDLVDRFAFPHNPAHLARVYDAIIAREPKLRERFGSAERIGEAVAFHTGEEAAAELFFRAHGDYDAIVSNAVLEHLYDPLSALEAMAAALKPGGQLLHQVDFRDHGMYSAGGHHELTFLTVPGWFYPWMSRRRGRPNRVLVHRYRETLARLGLDHRILVTHLVGVGAIEPAPYAEIDGDLRQAAEARAEEIRPKLSPDFRDLPAADLAVASIFIAARR